MVNIKSSDCWYLKSEWSILRHQTTGTEESMDKNTNQATGIGTYEWILKQQIVGT